MNKTKLAIDNDDVIIDLNEGMRLFHNENYGTNYESEDVKEFALNVIWNCTEEESIRRIFEFWLTPYFHNLEPVKGAFAALEKLKEKYELYVLTARPEEVRDETKLAIDKHFPNLFTGVHFAPAFGASKKKEKVDVCRELGIEVLIDDGIHNLELCAKEGIDCYLFTTHWNRHHNDEELKEKNIIRVYNWNEVLEKLL